VSRLASGPLRRGRRREGGEREEVKVAATVSFDVGERNKKVVPK